MADYRHSYGSWQPLEEGECCVAVSHSTGLNGISFPDYANLPCYPEEIANTVEGIWATQSILGRTGTINAFTGTSDISISFSFDLHREMPVQYANYKDCPYTNVDAVIAYIKSGCYPKYGAGSLTPPYVVWKFGQTIISGRLKSVSDVWKKPIINQLYVLCTLSITMESATVGIANANGVLNLESPGMPNAGSTFTPPNFL